MAPTYRLYLLGAGGDIVGASDLWSCADDASAIQAARGRANGFAIELWRGARLVHRSDPSEARTPPRVAGAASIASARLSR
jgi:hypothetical protein